MTRIAIVTGAGQGIGEGIARQLVQDGLSVAVADMNEKNARNVADEIGNNSKGYYVDVSDKKSVFDLIDHVVADFGKLDVLVNNAGIAQIGTLLDTKEEDFDKIMNVNIKGVLFGIQLPQPNLRNKEPAEKLSVPHPLLATRDSSYLGLILQLNLPFEDSHKLLLKN